MASGSGLGLAIAREIARVMGGDVRLESDAHPTVFTLDLPWHEAPTFATGPASPFSRENTGRDPQHV
jgi:nitrogen-specific signal transduction histidine kinase